MFEFFYSFFVFCKWIFFVGNNEYLVMLWIILFVIVFIIVVYLIKLEVYDSCNCLLKLLNDD